MRYIDISTPLRADMLVYEGDPRFAIHPVPCPSADPRDFYSLSVLSMATHTGTHVDPPAHMIRGGRTADALPPESLCGPAVVVDVRGRGWALDEAALAPFADAFRKAGRLLLKTDGTRLDGGVPREWAHLTGDGARFLRGFGFALVGIDTLSVDGPPDPWPGFGFPAHHALLDGDDGAIILEGIDLSGVEPGVYELLCLPLRIAGGDGGPARAFLRG